MNASTRLSMNGKSLMILFAPPFVPSINSVQALTHSKDEGRAFQKNQVSDLRSRISKFGFRILGARWTRGTASFLFIATTCLVAPAFAADAYGVTNIFRPLSTPAQAIHEVSLLVLAICAGIFLVVGGLLAYTVIRFRHRPGDDGREPPQIYGSNQLEFAWTVIPIVTVFVLFLATARTIYDVQGAIPPADALNVTVVGHPVVVGNSLPGTWHRDCK